MATTETLGADLLSAVGRITRWASSLTDFPIPSAQARLLALIDGHGPARISELARADHCSQPTMTTQVQRLEDHGWVTRQADPDDARAVLITLSPEGRRLLSEIRDSRVRSVAPTIARLDRGQAARLLDAVDVLEELLVVASQPAEQLQEVGV